MFWALRWNTPSKLKHVVRMKWGDPVEDHVEYIHNGRTALNMSSLGETPGLTQSTLWGLHIPSCLGMPWDQPGGAGGCSCVTGCWAWSCCHRDLILDKHWIMDWRMDGISMLCLTGNCWFHYWYIWLICFWTMSGNYLAKLEYVVS